MGNVSLLLKLHEQNVHIVNLVDTQKIILTPENLLHEAFQCYIHVYNN